MIRSWDTASNKTSRETVLAHSIMSKDDTDSKKSSMKGDWKPGAEGAATRALFTPDEMDIYVNKVTLEAYIFHGKKVDYEAIERLEYDPNDHSVDVVMKNGTRLDLGVKIQWLVRPYFTKAGEINIVQTKDGDSIEGTIVPLVHKARDKKN